MGHTRRYASAPVFDTPAVTPDPPHRARMIAKYEDLRNKACSGQRLSPNDWKLYEMLHSDLKNSLHVQKADTTASVSNNIGLNMSNILAFANVHPSCKPMFHKDTNNMWSKAAAYKPAQAKTVIKLNLDQLIREDASFSLCIHNQLLDTLVNVQFEPGDMLSTKPHLGLSVLAFVPRKSEEIKGLTHQMELMERANFITTDDTEKVKLGAPLLPNTLAETIEALKRTATFIKFVLGPDCSYGLACNDVVKVLQRKYEIYYKMSAQFGRLYGHEILYQLHLEAIEFFGTITMEEEYEAGLPNPETDTTWLLKAINSQQIRNSDGRPPMFGGQPPKTQTNASTQTSSNNKVGPNSSRTSNKAATNRTKQERKLPADFIKAHEEFTAKTSKKMMVANICKGLGLTESAALAKLLGLDDTKDCYRIHLLGSCPGCPRGHTVNPNFKGDAALEALKKATIA